MHKFFRIFFYCLNQLHSYTILNELFTLKQPQNNDEKKCVPLCGKIIIRI